MERVLVSRQPIFRADMAELGYELLFRDSDQDRASFTDGDEATASVIVNSLMEIGLDALVGSNLAFINFDRNLILGNYCECLPRQRVVIELLATAEPDDILISKLRPEDFRAALVPDIRKMKLHPTWSLPEQVCEENNRCQGGNCSPSESQKAK